MKQWNKRWMAGMAGLAVMMGFSGCTSKVAVPTLEGLDLKAATAALQSAGLQAGPAQGEFTGAKAAGTILRQEPAAATPLARGGTVRLTVEENVVVPGLTGTDLASAQRILDNLGLRLQKLEKKFVGGTLSNVVSQTPASGLRVATGSAVDLVIDDFVVVPDYVGQNVSEVRKTLAQAGLRLGARNTKAAPKSAPGTVLDQAPDVGEKVPPGTVVAFAVAAAPGETPGTTTPASGRGPDGKLVDTKSDTTDKLLALVETAVDLATNRNQPKPDASPNSDAAAGKKNAPATPDKTAERVRTGLGILEKLFGSKN